jgi:hypothetical protein
MVKVGQYGHCVHGDEHLRHEHNELQGAPAEAAQADVRVAQRFTELSCDRFAHLA